MLLFTPQERRAIFFVASFLLIGTLLDISFKLRPSAYSAMDLLDRPRACPRVNINHATYEELLAVPGLGPSSAARIIYRRQDKGPFISLDELIAIKGISKRSLKKAVTRLTVGAP